MRKFLDGVYQVFGKLAEVGSDKYLHMFAGLILAFVIGKSLAHVEAWAFPAIVGTLLLMIGKESVDYWLRNEQFDLKDVAAGLVGAVVGVILCLL